MVQTATDSEKDTFSANDLPPTEMIYYTYDGNFRLECEAEILAVRCLDDDNNDDDKNDAEQRDRTVEIVLNRTVLHAQGGGQPTDHGSICPRQGGSGEDEPRPPTVAINRVVLNRATGIATHTGTVRCDAATANRWVGRTATVKVDADRRGVLSECHTAGHVVDAAMARCGTGLPPTKGYHFLEGPYVEYKGKISPDDKERLLGQLQQAFSELVSSDVATAIDTVPLPEAENICGEGTGGEDWYGLRAMFGTTGDDNDNDNDNDNDGDEPPGVRIVRVAGWPVPCGGTHAKSTGDLASRNWGIVGLRSKKGVVRVRYGMECVNE
eukprot:jgi/Psemu1/250503/estExt_Genewise1Plus.C_180088